MDRQLDSRADAALLRFGLALLIFLGWLVVSAKGQEQSTPETLITNTSIHATHILGFEGMHRNAGGELSIQDDAVQFQREGKTAEKVSLGSIQNVSVGEEDRQVGGVPMMLGKSAVPFGGGRVVSLFSHKKYDSLTIEYVDGNGGFHGAIFRVPKGAGQIFKDNFIAHGAHLGTSGDRAFLQNTGEHSPNAVQQWSLLVSKVDPGTTTLDPCFADAIYEDLVKELSKSKQFKNVFRSGDRNATTGSGVLILKTLATKYSAGSETRRAVTTVTGATKLNIQIQLLTKDGRVVLERNVQGNVRFYGNNLRSTGKVAHSSAKLLAKSTLPEPTAPDAKATASNSDGSSRSGAALKQSAIE